MAECTEYAALTQNLYSFMGINTYYVTGNYTSDIKKNELHAFNLIQLDPESFYIVDSAIPTITCDMNFNIINSRPTIIQIPKDEFIMVRD